MKIQTAILVFGLIYFFATASETNWVTAATWFREVDGQLYNTDLSKRFENFGGTVVGVLTNAVLLERKSVRELYSGGYRSDIKVTPTIETEDFIVTNFPMDLQPTTGSNQRGRALRVGTINYNGQVLKLYDYGTPHRVMVVTTNSTEVK